MPRIRKKKKKKRTGDKESRSKKKCLNERETLSYEQQIVDNNRQLARLRSRNNELEEEAENARERFRQLEEDRSDVVAHLKRTLDEKQEETKELHERLSALEELHKEEVAAFKKKEDAMELEYRTMESNLSAEVKLAAGKLNALEDWRLARLDLMQKFENQEKEIAEQDQRHNKALYEAEKSLVIGKAMMKKEMEERLKDLSEAFRRATNLRIAEVTDRTVRENIVMSQELDEILTVCRELESANNESKEADRILKLQCKLFETEAAISLRKTMKQRDAINKLVDDLQRSIVLHGKAERENSRLAIYRTMLEDCKRKSEQIEEKARFLEQCLLKTKEDKEKLFEEVQVKRKEFDELKNILKRARNCIKEALQMQENTLEDDYCDDHLKHKLLLSLQEILETENITSILRYSQSQIEGTECPYTQGSLGLVQPSAYVGQQKVCVRKEEDDNGKSSIANEATEKLEEKRPSCVSSDISSNVPSPIETISDDSQ